MKLFRELKESRQTTAVFVFGRFNPPTTGHEVLLNKLVAVAKQYRGDAFIFSSHSQDAKKNPLQHRDKMRWISKMYPAVMRVVGRDGLSTDTSIRTAIDVAVKLDNYDKLVMVVGSDRVNDLSLIHI